MAAQKNSKRNEMTTILATLENRLTQLFGARYQEVIRINQVRKAIEAGQEFKFDSSPAAARQLEAIISQLAMQASSLIKQGDKEAWEAGDKNASRTLAATFGKTTDGQKTLDALTERGKEDMRARGATAEQHYRNREEAVTFSTGVWKEQAQKDLELIIQNGIKQGKSAEQISRDIRPFLNNPNAYYRRVRNKETGELELSEAAKKYHPGPGVYRSAFKNALRLARTEVNIAYATAQWETFQSNPLVTGIRISLSNNHTTLNRQGKRVPLHDMCDELQGDYPKTFRWTPWHPQCRCTMTPITISDDDFKKRMSALFAGTLDDWKPQDTVTKMPETFTGWMDRNKERLAKGKSIPAFVKDNYLNGNPLAKLNPAITELEAEVRKQAPTPIEGESRRLYNVAIWRAPFIDEDTTILDELFQTGDEERMLEEANRISKKAEQAYLQVRRAQKAATTALDNLLAEAKDEAVIKQATALQRQMNKNINYNQDKATTLLAAAMKAQSWVADEMKKIQESGYQKETYDTLDERGKLQFLVTRLNNLKAMNPKTVYMASMNALKYERLVADRTATKTQLNQAIKQAKSDIDTVLQGADPDLQKNMKEWLTGKATTEMNRISMRGRTFAALIGEKEEVAREIAESIQDYTYQWDEEIRAYQCGRDFTPRRGHSKAAVKRKAETIEGYLKKAPSWEGVSYRGITLSEDQVKPFLNPGYVFDMMGISSWTVSRPIADGFANKYKEEDDDCAVVFICRTGQPRGTTIRGVSYYGAEHEILASSTARWRVTSWKLIGTRSYEIACEAL